MSVILIWGLTGWLVFEAVLRIIDTQEVDGWFMFGTAVFGLCCNIVMAKVLHGGGGHSHGGGGGHADHGKKKEHAHGGGKAHGEHGGEKKGHGDHGGKGKGKK